MNEDPHDVTAKNDTTSQAQRDENVRTGSESLPSGVGHVGEPTAGEGFQGNQRHAAGTAQMPNGITGGVGSEFRLGDRITIRPLGSAGTGEVELLLAGQPNTVKVSDVELAGFLVEKYFTDDRTL